MLSHPSEVQLSGNEIRAKNILLRSKVRYRDGHGIRYRGPMKMFARNASSLEDLPVPADLCPLFYHPVRRI